MQQCFHSTDILPMMIVQQSVNEMKGVDAQQSSELTTKPSVNSSMVT